MPLPQYRARRSIKLRRRRYLALSRGHWFRGGARSDGRLTGTGEALVGTVCSSMPNLLSAANRFNQEQAARSALIRQRHNLSVRQLRSWRFTAAISTASNAATCVTEVSTNRRTDSTRPKSISTFQSNCDGRQPRLTRKPSAYAIPRTRQAHPSATRGYVVQRGELRNANSETRSRTPIFLMRRSKATAVICPGP